ncbi:MAG: type II secretion system protein [Planctomycetes bacterium]|nr:type II secretion system protein [Planctomycetota bacterium]
MTTSRRGFTLLELIVTISLILILAAIVIVALGGVRAAANRTDSAAALRGMALGYNAYHVDHNGRLMPGYVSKDRVGKLGISTRLPSGPKIDKNNNPADASSYVWRLSPYVEDEWSFAFRDYRNRELDSQLKREVASGVYGPDTGDPAGGEVLAARAPAYGLNSIMLGGDDVHGGTDIALRNPWDSPGDSLAVTRFSEVKAPGRVILFAPVVYFGDADSDPDNNLITDPPVSDVAFGYPELRPPFLELDEVHETWIEPQWALGTGGVIVATPQASYDEGGGWPIARWGDQLPVAHLDGSVSTHSVPDLFYDMRLWSPTVTGDYATVEP